MNLRPYFITFGIIAALVLIAFGVYECKREDHIPDVTKMVSEQARTAIIQTNTTEHAKYTDRDKLLARIKALRSDSLATAKGKDKQASEKARQSALKYRDSGKAEDCKDALSDCQEECETKSYSIAVQERMIRGFESSDSLHREEIERQGETIVKLDSGWKKANEELAKEKGKRFGLGVQLGGSIINSKPTPYFGIGLSWQFLKF